MKRANLPYFMLVLPAFLVFAGGCHITFTSMDGYSFNYRGEKAERSETDSLAAEVTRLEIDNRFGEVHVIATTDEPRWEWTIECWSDELEDAEALTKEVKLERVNDGELARFSLLLPEPSSDFNGAKSVLKIYANQQTSVECSNTFGDVRVNGLAAESSIDNRHGDVYASKIGSDVNIRCRHGNVQVQDVAGEADVETSHANIDISGVNGTARLKTSHGNIDADSFGGDAVVRTSHGNIKLDGFNGKLNADVSHGNLNARGRATTVNAKGSHGDLRMSLISKNLRTLNAKTSHADIEVELESDYSAEFNLRASHGSVSNAFDSDNNSPNKVDLRTSHGSVKVFSR